MASHKVKKIPMLNIWKLFYRLLMKLSINGLIVTGAPVEQMPSEEVDYWQGNTGF